MSDEDKQRLRQLWQFAQDQAALLAFVRVVDTYGEAKRRGTRALAAQAEAWRAVKEARRAVAHLVPRMPEVKE